MSKGLVTSGFGRLAADPVEVQVGDTTKANFTIVWNEFRKSKVVQGEYDKVPHFIDCEVWDTAARFMLDNVKKGDEIYIEGLTRQEKWEKDGEKRQKVIIRVTEFKLVTAKKTETVNA